MLKTFKGGIHLPDYKNSIDCPIENISPPAKVFIPMQHNAIPTVKKGEYVKKGQIIGVCSHDQQYYIHASVSGMIADIQTGNSYQNFGNTEYVIIENDFTNTLDESVERYTGDIFKEQPKKIIDTLYKCGISLPSSTENIKEIIINSTECEPYITKNHRLVIELSEKIVSSARILGFVTEAANITIAIDDSNPDTFETLNNHASQYNDINIKLLKTKYPQNNERQLLYSLKNIELSYDKRPNDVGYAIFDIETCLSVYNAVYEGLPYTDTVITVDGDAINDPKNIRVPLGTTISDIADFCNGVKNNLSKIVCGGPMTGRAVWDVNEVVTKSTNAILFLSDKNIQSCEETCIRCGRCVSACPMHLMPNYLAKFSIQKDIKRAIQFGMLSCIECGSCTYICPGNVSIVQYIRMAKDEFHYEIEKESEAKS